MSTGDLAATVVILLGFAAFVVLVLATAAILRRLRQLAEVLDLLRAEALPAVAELRDAAREAGLEVERIDDLLISAETVSATIEGASRLGYLAFRRPLIRAIAVLRGVCRGLWSLVGGGRAHRRANPAGAAADQPPPTDMRDRRRRGRKAA